jgi:hypothetical protein
LSIRHLYLTPFSKVNNTSIALDSPNILKVPQSGLKNAWEYLDVVVGAEIDSHINNYNGKTLNYGKSSKLKIIFLHDRKRRKHR